MGLVETFGSGIGSAASDEAVKAFLRPESPDPFSMDSPDSLLRKIGETERKALWWESFGTTGGMVKTGLAGLTLGLAVGALS